MKKLFISIVTATSIALSFFYLNIFSGDNSAKPATTIKGSTTGKFPISSDK